MSFAQVYTRSVVGLHAPDVMVEVHLSGGLPSLTIVGLPEAAVRESKDRVRSAIMNSGYQFPNRKLTINLAPADIPKDGSRLDLPIALGILAASGQIQPEQLADYEFIGELALNGDLREVKGALAVARSVKTAGRNLVLPKNNADEAARVANLAVYAAKNLRAVCLHLAGNQLISPSVSSPQKTQASYSIDLADVKGQHRARRALEIAAAGGHSILFSGPPGTGKTLLASRLPTIMPPLSDDDSLAVASIYSVANVQYDYGIRPFRSPHHTASAAALVGGGSQPRPGEITLAHLGVLFLDELPEFDRKVLEVLRQPLEAKEVVISRAARQVTFPANFQLVGAMNPCPCGYAGDRSSRCKCSPDAINRYRAKLSGPLLDRIDLHIEVPALPAADLQTSASGESSDVVRARVVAAYQLQIARQGFSSSNLMPDALTHMAGLGDAEKQLMQTAQQKLNLSARAYHRVLRVARTIADLAGSERIENVHLTESLGYRGFEV